MQKKQKREKADEGLHRLLVTAPSNGNPEERTYVESDTELTYDKDKVSSFIIGFIKGHSPI